MADLIQYVTHWGVPYFCGEPSYPYYYHPALRHFNVLSMHGHTFPLLNWLILNWEIA